MWLVFVNLYISEYVVHETGKSRCCLGTDNANTSDEGAVHRPLNEAKDMFNTTSGLGFQSIVLLLLVCQGMITVAFFSDDWNHAALSDHIILADIAGIKTQLLSFVFFFYERFYDV